MADSGHPALVLRLRLPEDLGLHRQGTADALAIFVAIVGRFRPSRPGAPAAPS
ncbi:hypothetical protein [Bacillus subtilis]|uniref:hypothetical protein n=1 Tax=Bacillus subtilis TaxID=1423 RepID=UPI00279B7C12|nr:hypothetical protein P5635_00075 [Bacillus subtilis]